MTRLDYPWSIATRELQLEWWRRYGNEVLMRDRGTDPMARRIVFSRPPDDIRYLGEEEIGRGESIVRRHTWWKTWPVKVVNVTIADILGLFWNHEPHKVGMRIHVNERTYTHEEDIAGA